MKLDAADPEERRCEPADIRILGIERTPSFQNMMDQSNPWWFPVVLFRVLTFRDITLYTGFER